MSKVSKTLFGHEGLSGRNPAIICYYNDIYGLQFYAWTHLIDRQPLTVMSKVSKVCEVCKIVEIEPSDQSEHEV